MGRRPGLYHDNIHACCSLSSVDDAKAVASVLGIPHYTLDFRDIFRRDVIDYFVDAYVHGRTPNPCIACNKFIKFGLLWEKVKQFGADFLATGHYARIVKDEGRESIPCSAAQTAARTSPMSSIS